MDQQKLSIQKANCSGGELTGAPDESESPINGSVSSLNITRINVSLAPMSGDEWTKFEGK